MANCVIVGFINSAHGCTSFARTAAANGFKLLSNGGSILVHPDSNPTKVTWSFCTGICRTLSPILNPGDVLVNVPSLAGLYEEIHSRAPNAKIRVLLYPQLFPDHPSANCTVGTFTSIGHIKYRPHLTPAEMTELNTLGSQLNQTISTQVDTARQAGIDIDTVPASGFSGHAICDSGTPWINGVIWNTFFHTFSVLNSPSVFSFHPNALGQTAFSEAMQAKL